MTCEKLQAKAQGTSLGRCCPGCHVEAWPDEA